MKNSLKTDISFVVLSICTFKRPKIFSQCLETVAKLNLPQNVKVELLIIDNDSAGSAKETVENFKEQIKIPVNYFVEEKRGLSNARNRLITEAVNLGASHIAMFDDDILLPENWLVNYVNYYNENDNAVIITAASYAAFTEKPPKYIEKNDLFKCSTTKKTGSVRKDAASGNVFFPVSVITDLGLSFKSDYVFMGGEDGKFFEEASSKGAAIVWCNDCFNRELNGTDKINIGWIVKRSHYNGYSAAQNAIKRKQKFSDRIIYTVRQILSFIVNCLILPFSIILGFTAFVNMLGFVAKSLGRVQGAVKKVPLNYYETTYGD
ncbi:MAG: glycosyltransferase family 2 protein [Candidatus Gastranaerophilales bacterium]|nr:glycosyltransferase family 2 protein [Candidatus Gastranaerophilales bacterium]